MSSLKTRLRSLHDSSKKLFVSLGIIVKHFFLASVVFIGIPFIYVATDIGPRLDASIYDYFNFLILCWLAFRLETIVRMNRPAEVEVEEEEEAAELPLLDKERENLMRLKRKLDRRRKNKNN